MTDTFDLNEAMEDGIDAYSLGEDNAGLLELTPERIERLRAFVLDRWRERASERREPVPEDLTGACNFGVLTVKAVFGGIVRGNYDHHHNVVDGTVVDLSEGAADVRALPEPYRHDPDHFRDNATLYEQFDSCLPRVARWAQTFVELESTPSPGP